MLTPQEIQRLRLGVLSEIELPGGRFFTPTPRFWEFLRKVYADGVRLTDCGTGSGDLLEEAVMQNLPMRGVDVCKRQHQSRRVEMRDAITIHDWGPKHWPLICRPSHDGWANEVVECATNKRAVALWATKSSNFEQDLSGYGTRCRRVCDNVGRQGERLYMILPRA